MKQVNVLQCIDTQELKEIPYGYEVAVGYLSNDETLFANAADAVRRDIEHKAIDDLIALFKREMAIDDKDETAINLIKDIADSIVNSGTFPTTLQTIVHNITSANHLQKPVIIY